MNTIRPLWQAFPVAALALALGACGGGGSSSDAAPTHITGNIVKGATANAGVTVYRPNADGTFTQLAYAVSDSEGAFAVDLPPGYQGAVKIVASPLPNNATKMRCDVSGGCGAFPAPASAHDDPDHDGNIDFGDWGPVAADFSLSAVASVEGGGLRLINLTPLSTVAANWAETFPQGIDATSADTANERAALAFGFSAADLNKPLRDVAQADWLRLADTKQVQLSLLMATIAATAGGTNNISNAIQAVSDEFISNHGNLLEDSDQSLVPTVAAMLHAQLTVAGTLTLPPVAYSEIQSSMNATLGSLQKGSMSVPVEATPEDMFALMGPLGRDLQEVLDVTGLMQPDQFIINQTPYFDWLLADDNLLMAKLGIESVLQTLFASVALDFKLPYNNTVEGYTVSVNPATSTLTLKGTKYSQVVDLTIGLTSMCAGLDSRQFNFSVDGTVTNATSTGVIHATMGINAGTTDLAGLRSFFVLCSGTTVATAGVTAIDFTQLQPTIANLIRHANGSLTVNGTATLTRNSDTTQMLGGEISLNAKVKMDATSAEPSLVINVTHFDGWLPNGTHLYNNGNLDVMKFVIQNKATVVIDGKGDILNLPTATAHAEGTMENAQHLFDHVRDTVAAMVETPPADLATGVNQLLDFNFQSLTLAGSGVINIPHMPSGRDHQYRAELQGEKLKIYQPFSNDVAIEMPLKLRQLANDQIAYFKLGKNQETWALKPMMTPTPRLMLLGPHGEFIDVTQEEFFAFLNKIPLDKLFPSLMGSTPATTDTVATVP